MLVLAAAVDGGVERMEDEEAVVEEEREGRLRMCWRWEVGSGRVGEVGVCAVGLGFCCWFCGGWWFCWWWVR